MMYPFTYWEDWHLGLYSTRLDPTKADAAADLLSDPLLLHVSMVSVTVGWPYATSTQMTQRTGATIRPWLGQAACLFAVGACRRETTTAWGRLTSDIQHAANAIADSVAYHWRLDQTQISFGTSYA